jgi:ribonuclease D
MKRRAKRAGAANSDDSPGDAARRPSKGSRRPEDLVNGQTEFDELCARARAVGLVAFDTEFVSEHTYRPQLCLLQLAIGDECIAVDTLKGIDLTGWWELVADDETTVVAHGSQAEIRFCLDAIGEPPRRFVDVQLAEGLLSRSYPLSYTNLIARVLGQQTHGKQTRTDWSRRPLSDKQLEYALEDVVHLQPVWAKQRRRLEKLGRLAWAEAEFERLIADVAADRVREPWTRLPGASKLSRRDLAVLRELAECREMEARERDRLPRRILRDDLLIDIARRHPRTVGELLETRDMNRGNYRKLADDLLAAVERGLSLPEHELPSRPGYGRREKNDDEHVLGQLLGIALSNRCAELGLSMSLVGTASDLRELVRWHVFEKDAGERPSLMEGWREEVCGDLMIDVLDGRITMRVADVASDHPLVFERRE